MKPLAGWIVSVLVALVFLLPLIWMVQASFRPERQVFETRPEKIVTGDWTLENYPQAWKRAGLAYGLTNSFIQVSGIVLLGLVINSMAAYAFARLQFPGRDILFALVVILIILPVEVLAIPLLMTVKDLHLVGGRAATMAALILPFAARAFNIYFLRQHFLSLPQELEEAATIDGAGAFTIFWRVALPSIRPALATVVVLDVLMFWGAFLWPLLISTGQQTQTVQLSLATLKTSSARIEWGDIMACAVVATVPIMLVFRYCQKHIVATEYAAGIR